MAAPQGWEQRTTHFGFDLVRLIVLERLGPDGAADVIDEDIDATEALDGRRHDAAAFGVLLKVGGQGQDLGDATQLLLQFEDQFRTVDQHQACAFGGHAFGDPTADALCGTGDQGDFFVEALSAHIYLIQIRGPDAAPCRSGLARDGGVTDASRCSNRGQARSYRLAHTTITQRWPRISRSRNSSA
ncbi:hypothetical protein D9M71_386560 [compost metagenome]